MERYINWIYLKRNHNKTNEHKPVCIFNIYIYIVGWTPLGYFSRLNLSHLNFCYIWHSTNQPSYWLNNGAPTVYPKKYAHGFCFAVLCCGYTLTDCPMSIRLTSLALWQSNDCPSASKATPMNMDKYFMWIHYERLHNRNKAKHNKPCAHFLGYTVSAKITCIPWQATAMGSRRYIAVVVIVVVVVMVVVATALVVAAALVVIVYDDISLFICHYNCCSMLFFQ